MYNMTRGATANLSQASPISPNILLHFSWPVVSYKSLLKPKIQTRPRQGPGLWGPCQPWHPWHHNLFTGYLWYVNLFHIDNNKSKIKTNKTEKSITNSLSMRFKVCICSEEKNYMYLLYCARYQHRFKVFQDY